MDVYFRLIKMYTKMIPVRGYSISMAIKKAGAFEQPALFVYME